MSDNTIYIIIGLIIIAVLLYVVSVYNRIIFLKNKVEEAESDVDVQLKRRHDLIPNLVNTVKGATKFETETLEKVIKARQQAVDLKGVGADRQEAENVLSGALRQLFALSENYPDLKANQNFLSLQTEITNTEDRILASRRFYNSTVSDYNVYQTQFPNVLFKSLAGAKEAEFFELEDKAEAKNPEISFD